MISYIIPTRDRPQRLAATLRAMEALGPHAAEIIIADNASAVPASAPPRTSCGLPTKLLRLPRNSGAAARNDAARAADPASTWLVMLDDDSHPLDLGFLEAIAGAPGDVAAIAAEITLPSQNRRESGGLPEVFIGCGVAIRRSAFLEAGGYDPAFDYYAEEYDLAAKFLLAGSRIALDRRFQIAHHKIAQGRSMNRIMRRLVRNNTWTLQRYAPESLRRSHLRETFSRYGRIAMKENALPGYLLGAAEALGTLHRQLRSPMPTPIFDRFTGLATARASLHAAHASEVFRTAAIIEPGKNAGLIAQAAVELGVRLLPPDQSPEALIIGTLSPGPMLDAWDRHGASADTPRVIAPWSALLSQSLVVARMDAVPAAA